MNNFCKAAIVLSAFIAAAQCLTCRQCTIGVFGTCLLGSDITCDNATQSCFRGEAQMDDAEQSNIRSAITRVLPDLPASILDMLVETLQSLGVETTDDFDFIQEADLLSTLRPVQARRLVAAWKQTTQTNQSHSQSVLSSPSSSTCSSFSLSPSPTHWITADWVDSFQIPWTKCPEDLIQCLERGKRPSPRLRREMIRIVVSEMVSACASPSKKASTEVAKKMVAKYPQSLQDVIAGDVVGAGYHSLVKQLQARIENVKRSSAPRIMKRKRGSDECDTDEITAEQRAAVQDTYGCIKWDMKFMPVSETPESQQEKKDKLKVLSEQTNFSPDEVETLMKCTYYSQRKEINKGTDLQSLMEEWPFLFQEIGMTVHFQELTGVSLKETFLTNVEKKGKRLLDFMRTICADKSKRVLQAVTKLEILRGQLEGCSEDVKDMVLLLLAYFNEKEENLLHYVEETCLAKEVQVESLPVTPCIIVYGTSCYASRQFMLSVDGKVVNDHIPTFISAMCLMFGAYYCLNIHYPVDLGSTLEFLQRCFFMINPEKGTKVETKKNKKQLSVNPRVLTLIADLSNHDWREFNATGSLSLHIRGCVDSDLCGKTLTGTLLGAGYTSSFQCCTTNLCNGAASVQLPLTVALCAAILSSLWGLWEL